MFGRKTPFYCYNMYLTAAILVSLSLVYMVMVSLLYGYGGGSSSFFPAFYRFGFYFLPPFALFVLFSFGGSLIWILFWESGWRSFILHDVMQQPDNPKTVLLFFITTSLTSLLSYTLSSIRCQGGGPPCMFVCDHKRCPKVFFFQHLVWAGSSSRFSVLCSIQFPGGQDLVIPISFHGQWSKIASMRPFFFRFLGFGSGGWLLSICACTSYSIPRL